MINMSRSNVNHKSRLKSQNWTDLGIIWSLKKYYVLIIVIIILPINLMIQIFIDFAHDSQARIISNVKYYHWIYWQARHKLKLNPPFFSCPLILRFNYLENIFFLLNNPLLDISMLLLINYWSRIRLRLRAWESDQQTFIRKHW